MKVCSYTALHYGVEYLEYALRSVIDVVDEAWILYTPVGSHGSRTDRVCPDSRDDLFAAATRGAGDKLRWYEGQWETEGQQRDTIHLLAPDADVILTLDSDEIWKAPNLRELLSGMVERKSSYRIWRVPMLHYWRSFYRAVLGDPAYPERLWFKDPGLEGTRQFPAGGATINHMGYALRPEIVGYKWLVHGHLNEYRRDVNWFEDKYLANAREDCHPVGSEYWQPEDVNPLDYMPSWMSEHPYFNKMVIE